MSTPRTVIRRKMKGMSSITPTSENWPKVILPAAFTTPTSFRKVLVNEK